jgi:hypothetical protein
MDAMVHSPTLMCDCYQLIHHNAEIRTVLKQRHQTKEGCFTVEQVSFPSFVFVSCPLCTNQGPQVASQAFTQGVEVLFHYQYSE